MLHSVTDQFALLLPNIEQDQIKPGINLPPILNGSALLNISKNTHNSLLIRNKLNENRLILLISILRQLESFLCRLTSSL